MNQLGLPLDWPADAAQDQFLIGDANRRAAAQIEHWGAWPVMTNILVGPRKSGRSLLGRVFVAKTGGTLIDDAERQGEAELFHAWNRAQEVRRPLLLIADEAPPHWQPRLADLRSRLAATPVARIGPPDDALMSALFAQAFARRGLNAGGDVIRWLVTRVERSYLAVLRVIDALDHVTLSRRRRLSIPLARATLAEHGLLLAAEPI